MSTSTSNTARKGQLQKKKPLIIWCHGSGDTGEGAQAWIEHLVSPAQYAQWDWIFPTAQPIPYQLNGGMVSSVWYDRNGGFDPAFPEHLESIERSTTRLLQLIQQETTTSSEGGSGRDPSQIIIGGFSMGGAIALQTASRWHAHAHASSAASQSSSSLGGVFGLSCYLNHNSKVWSILDASQKKQPTKNWPPTFIAHGGHDDFILPQWGQQTYERLVEKGIPASFRIVPGVHHDMVKGEIQELLQYLKTNLEDKQEEESDTKESASSKNMKEL